MRLQRAMHWIKKAISAVELTTAYLGAAEATAGLIIMWL
jgi:hypothetical protein